MNFANVFSLSFMLILALLPGCSSDPNTETETEQKVDTINVKDQLSALKLANKELYTNPKSANNIANVSENWSLEGEALAQRQWLHTQQQANRGDYDQAWRMIHEINHAYLPKSAQQELSTLYWQLASSLNVCPQRQGSHAQQFNYLAATNNTQCEQYVDNDLKKFMYLVKDFNSPDWGKNLKAWHEQNPSHWAGEFVKWHKLKDTKHTPTQIAVILPFSGEFAKAGKDIQDGMLSVQPFLSQTTLSFHDTNELGVQEAYNQALKTNPTFIIGPLTNKDMQSLNIDDKTPMIAFAPPKYPNKHILHMAHDPYQIPKLLLLSKKLGHEHLVWLTDPVFNNMQSYWPNSVARFSQIPIKADALKTLLMVDNDAKQTTNTNLSYDGIMMLGHDTFELQTVAHEYLVNPVQTFVTLPDTKDQKNFFEHTVMLKSAWMNPDNDNPHGYAPFNSVLSKINAHNQSWYNAVGIDALLFAYYSDEINTIKTPMYMATGLREVTKNEFGLKLNAYHIKDSKWHPLLALNSI